MKKKPIQKADPAAKEGGRYQRFFEASYDGILLIDAGTRKIFEANFQMSRLLGYSRKELIGRELFEIGFLRDEAASRQMFRKLKRHMEVRYENLPLQGKDGQSREVEVVANLHIDGGRSVAQCSVRDISERKSIELALSRLASIVSFSDDAIIGKDTDGIVTDWNAGAERMFGYTAREMVGASIMRLIPEDRHGEEFRILASIKRGRRVEHFETVRKTKDGRLIDISVTVSPIKNMAGKIIGASKVARDISERKRGEVALNQLASIVAFSEDAIIGKDTNGIVTTWNKSAERMFGYTAEEMIGDSIMRLIPDDRRNEESRILARIKSGKRVEHFETVRKTKDGKRIDISVTVSPIKNAAGKIIGASKVARDITARKREEESRQRISLLTASNRTLELEVARREVLEKDLLKSRQEQKYLQEQTRRLAQQALRAQEDEQLRISRELHDQVSQTLIGINVRMTNLLSEAHGSPDFQRRLGQLQGLVENAAETVHGLSQNMRPLLLDDLGLIPALRDLLKTFMTETGIRATLAAFAKVENADNASLTVLYRVAQQALSNVARHSKARNVEVRIQKIADRMCMTITDDGIGCKGDPFLRAKKKKRLGLVGMRERLEMVGGAFKVDCAHQKGTTVTAEIPL